MHDNPHILYLVTEDWYFVSHRLGLARAMRDAGLSVTVVTRIRDHGDIINNEGFRILPFLLTRSRLSIMYELRSIVNLIRIYRRERPDIVHHVGLKPSLYGSIAALFISKVAVVNVLTGLGFVFTSGHWMSRTLQPVVRFFWRLVLTQIRGRTIVQNPDDLSTLRQAGMLRDATTRMIRGSGVDLSIFKKLPDPIGIMTVAFVSRMLKNKGVEDVVEATRILHERGYSMRTILIGMPDPDNPTSISADQLCEWHDDGLIQWLGYRDDVAEIWRYAHIAILPSYREGLPKSLLEAAASGRPIVATDVPGCREIVQNGKNGFLVPLQDPLALAQAIEALLNDKALRERMGAHSREMIETSFHQNLIIHETMKVYEELLMVTLTPKPSASSLT
ncbi:MAG: glycosyltransferase family 1 protein [Rhodospirillales bacterium]|nr:glycosyltransferase family 1 protein [Rhodospirillales bacterium]